MSEKQNIITIDGPAGVGKSTVSKKVAAATGFTYLDTGAMYRGVGFYLQKEATDLKNTELIRKQLSALEMVLVPATDDLSDVGICINGQDVSGLIRTPEMAMVASGVSAIPVVREILTAIQQGYGEKGGIVAEGRDTGTVVFPRAAFKFYLDAKAEERARRRYSQLKVRGESPDYNKLLAMTIERDKNDSERTIAPLKQAVDATRIDTTEIAIDDVVAKILDVVGR